MNKYTKIALVTLFVTTFTIFLGWIPIGVLIPQVLFFIVTLAMQPDVLASRTLVLYYLFFAYQIASELLLGVTSDFTVIVARFLGMAIPLIVSTTIFTSAKIRDCKGVSKYALIVSFITVFMSIRILANDGNALRVAALANSTGDIKMLYQYWRQGMASYDMAAMMMFMPIVLIFRWKSKTARNEKVLLLIGIITIIIFMYMGQVTTTFVLCLMVTLLSVLNFNNRSFAYVGLGLMVLLVITQFSSIMDTAISITGEGEMNDKFVTIAAASSGQGLDESSDAGVRMALLSTTIQSLVSHPIFGHSTAVIGGHNYFLDLLAKYGIVGCLPFFLLIRNQIKIITSYMSEKAKRYYLIIILGFVTLGLIKKISGTDYWNYLFIYYPAIIIWFDEKAKKSQMA